MIFNYEPSDYEYAADALRLEVITTCVGFDDLLDVALLFNNPQCDHVIVVTSHDDQKTMDVCMKHGATCVPTDLVGKNGRKFNKGAMINAGFAYFRYHGWRLHLDADIVLPSKFRQTLFNHTALDPECFYGADRIDVVGQEQMTTFFAMQRERAQHAWSGIVDPSFGGAIPTSLGSRYVTRLEGYLPLGYFQLWHALTQKPYPHSFGTAGHDDCVFAALYPQDLRRLLPTVLVYHLCTTTPHVAEHWDGTPRKVRLDAAPAQEDNR